MMNWRIGQERGTVHSFFPPTQAFEQTLRDVSN